MSKVICVSCLILCSEYIIDLMGAPGAMIPAEVPSSQLPNSFLNLRSLTEVTARPMGVGILADGVPEAPCVSKAGSSMADEMLSVPSDNGVGPAEENPNERSEIEFGKFLPLEQISDHTSLETSAKASSAQKKKVKNVSKYVISAAKDPEFAQKLHAVLLESGASPPPGLFSDISPQEHNEGTFDRDNLFSHQDQPLVPIPRRDCSNYGYIGDVPKQASEGMPDEFNRVSSTSDTTNQGYNMFANATAEPIQTDAISVATAPFDPSKLNPGAWREVQAHRLALPFAPTPFQRHLGNTFISDNNRVFQDSNEMDLVKDSAVNVMETATSGFGFCNDGQSERINTVLGDNVEWEIPWEDLRIGERIGIGKVLTSVFITIN